MIDDAAPPELERRLATTPTARTAWDALAPSHRRDATIERLLRD